MHGLGRYYELCVTCAGEADPATGYFMNIKQIDQAVRTHAVPIIEQACIDRPETDPSLVLGEVLSPLNNALGNSVRTVEWKLTPYYSVGMSPRTLETAVIKQQFDLAAAHRLFAPTLSDEANRAVFGKCTNPRGHGHNYRLEPSVRVPLAPGGSRFTLADLERITARTLLDRFDHVHLNLDTSEFDQSKGGLNPTVENIARVFYQLLAPEIDKANTGAKLERITVWETDKTSCSFPD